MGFESLYISERKHEPFMQLAIAAVNTERIRIGPEIALTFPRNPMVLAYTSWDLQRATNGRFILGLGTQVKAHNERRFGLKWEKPGPKLRGYILAIRHIWDCWQNDTELNFVGEFFEFNLMTPMFNRGPLDVGPPPIYVGAVNPWNCRMAGEVADGFHCHGFHTAKTLRSNVNERTTVIKTAFESLGPNMDAPVRWVVSVIKRVSLCVAGGLGSPSLGLGRAIEFPRWRQPCDPRPSFQHRQPERSVSFLH
jgi:probable F420-dependent oxidoreductase